MMEGNAIDGTPDIITLFAERTTSNGNIFGSIQIQELT